MLHSRSYAASTQKYKSLLALHFFTLLLPNNQKPSYCQQAPCSALHSEPYNKRQPWEPLCKAVSSPTLLLQAEFAYREQEPLHAYLALHVLQAHFVL